jgi:adenosylmethionine-8-amino-7-oxononanoate aminotransferase
MLIYSPDFLKNLSDWAKLNDVYLIADEILTGFYRTGEALASDHAAIKPDLICLSKGLTAGFMPMSAVLLSQEMYNLFYTDYQDGKSFLHSNTYAGNALAAAVALEALNIYQEENIKNNVKMIESELFSNKQLLEKTFSLKNLRSLGAVSAIDIDAPSEKRLGLEVYKVARDFGAILRPLANTIYWLPPLNSSKLELDMLSDITYRALKKVLG